LPTGSVLYVMMAVADRSLIDAVVHLMSKGTSVVPLVYDGASFDKRARIISATDPAFMGALRDAGAMPTVMPNEVEHG